MKATLGGRQLTLEAGKWSPELQPLRYQFFRVPRGSQSPEERVPIGRRTLEHTLQLDATELDTTLEYGVQVFPVIGVPGEATVQVVRDA